MSTVLYFSHLHGPLDPIHGPPAKNLLYRAGVHNIRPARKMWPAEALNLDAKTQILLISLIKTTFKCLKA